MSPSARKCATVRISPTALDIPKCGRHPDRDFLRRGDAGEVELVGSALPFDDFDASQYRASPMLGAHTLKVLASLSDTGVQIAALVEQSIVSVCFEQAGGGLFIWSQGHWYDFIVRHHLGRDVQPPQHPCTSRSRAPGHAARP